MKKYTTSERLKEIMTARGLKQVDILEAAKPYAAKYSVKLNKSDLSQYVNGQNEPGQRKLTILGLALNVSETWLMGYDVPMERETHEEKSALQLSETDKADMELFSSLDEVEREAVRNLMRTLKQNRK